MDSAALDVQTAISTAQGNLPPDLPNPPTFKKVNPSDTPILYIAVTSDTMLLSDIYSYAFTFVGQRLATVDGVAQVLTYGSPYAVRVQVDPEMLASQGVTLIDVQNAIKRATPNLPTGQIDGIDRTAIIRVDGQLKNAEEFNPQIISYKGGNPVRIEDVGEAFDSLQNVRFQLKYVDKDRTQRGVVVAIQRQPGSNTVEVAKRVKERLPELRAQLPNSLNLDVVYDKSLSIEESIFDVKLTLVIALILVVLVIFMYLGKPADTIIPSIAMPMSIVITFWFMDMLNFTIDNLSLLALTLATGFIVDDAIVVLENIVRRVENGESRFKAAIEGSKQISFTILSMTVSLAAVFIPLVFMYGLIGKIFFEFSMTMIIVILASGFVSLTLTPMLASFFVSSREGKDESYVKKFSD
ncbi:MAG: efflux RND transporter permease subunit, partial [Parachlamydiaceae bacterium]